MEVMTIGTLYMVLYLINRLMLLAKIILAAAVIILAIVIGVLIHDFKSKKNGHDE